MQNSSQTFPASQVKNNFGSIVNQVKEGKLTEVIVENRGEPVAAIIPISDFEKVKVFREKDKQSKAINNLRQLRDKIQSRTKGKIEDQNAEKIADKISREIIDNLEKKGRIKFERKSSSK